MLYKLINSQWQIFNGNIHKWVAQRRQAQFIKTSNKHEQYVSILQKRYGYSKEKATRELVSRYSNVRFF
jgi:hypothetical protein